MNPLKLPPTLILAFLTVCGLSAEPSDSSHSNPAAAAAGKHSISGAVSSSATRNMLQGAVVTLPGLGRETVTDSAGRFAISDLPSGPVDVVIDYSDFDEVRRQVTVGSGQWLDIVLHPTTPVQLPAYTVASEVEGNALAVERQREAPYLKSVIALDTDLTATMPNMDTGDLVTRISGVAPSFGQGTVNNVSVSGMASTLTRMTFDGLSGLNGVDGRRPTFIAFSGSLFQDLEVIKAHTPDMSADSIGGTINATTRDPLSLQDNFRLDYNIGARWAPPFFYRPTYEAQRSIEPVTAFDYQQVLDVLGGKHNLGFTLSTFFGQNLNETAKLSDSYQNTTAFPAYSYSTSNQELLDDRYVSGLNFKVEFRASDTSTFTFGYMFNMDDEPSEDLQNLTATAPQSLATSPTVGAVLPGYTNSFTQVQPISGSNVSLRSYHVSNNYKENMFTFGGKHTLGNLTLDYTGRYNLVHANDGSGNDGSGGTLVMTDPTVGWSIDRANPTNPILSQTAGNSIYNLASYTNSVTFTKTSDTRATGSGICAAVAGGTSM